MRRPMFIAAAADDDLGLARQHCSLLEVGSRSQIG
jgi:hypothetical protein